MCMWSQMHAATCQMCWSRSRTKQRSLLRCSLFWMTQKMTDPRWVWCCISCCTHIKKNAVGRICSMAIWPPWMEVEFHFIAVMFLFMDAYVAAFDWFIWATGALWIQEFLSVWALKGWISADLLQASVSVCGQIPNYAFCSIKVGWYFQNMNIRVKITDNGAQPDINRVNERFQSTCKWAEM